jgi:hypothetical protein
VARCVLCTALDMPKEDAVFLVLQTLGTQHARPVHGTRWNTSGTVGTSALPHSVVGCSLCRTAFSRACKRRPHPVVLQQRMTKSGTTRPLGYTPTCEGTRSKCRMKTGGHGGGTREGHQYVPRHCASSL